MRSETVSMKGLTAYQRLRRNSKLIEVRGNPRISSHLSSKASTLCWLGSSMARHRHCHRTKASYCNLTTTWLYYAHNTSNKQHQNVLSKIIIIQSSFFQIFQQMVLHRGHPTTSPLLSLHSTPPLHNCTSPL